MKHQFEYKGYFGSAEVSVEDNILFGRILFMKDVITYEASTVAELKTAFEEAVNDYLATCAEIGDQPDVPFKGTFNVRVGSELHRKAAMAAMRNDQSLNDFVIQALDAFLTVQSNDRPNAPLMEIHVSNASTLRWKVVTVSPLFEQELISGSSLTELTVGSMSPPIELETNPYVH